MFVNVNGSVCVFVKDDSSVSEKSALEVIN